MTAIIKDKQFDEERALYALRDASVENCVFAGAADGESVLKECRNIEVSDCRFSLRYPLWHVEEFDLVRSYMDELTRAPIWYCHSGRLTNSHISGVKAVRECANITVTGCEILSPEFGWKSHHITIKDTVITAEYLLLDSTDVHIERMKMKGKYSFQYVNGLTIKDSELDTKDAFWHSENITVENSLVKGEYLGWFSKGLTLINCHIIGTQPLCYCKDLKLINCTMDDTDLSFEYSDVEADIKGHIQSVKNPHSGYITADSIGKIILENSVMENNCILKTKNVLP